MRRIKYHATKRKTAVKWITVVLVFLIIPLETRWILTGAMAANSTPLEQNLEDFRSFELPTEEENDNYRKLALRQLYYEQRRVFRKVPCFFAWQLDKEILAGWEDAYATVLSDLKCFPVGYDGTYGETVSYENSWNLARNYGGNRRHEGVDLMTSNNKPGYFPAVSICDGTIEKMGWLPEIFLDILEIPDTEKKEPKENSMCICILGFMWTSKGKKSASIPIIY